MSSILKLEQEIKDNEELVARRKMAHKLSENREFRKLFHEEYFVTEAARLVQLSTDPALTKEQQADALAMAQATGHTRRYLSFLFQMGAHAEAELPGQREELAWYRANPESESEAGE